ncbi:MAG TPA: quinolinate synthase NadA [Polyangia bacterium]
MPPVAAESPYEAEIRALRARLGRRVVVLTHHYQRPEIVALGDLRGDSFELSRLAAADEASEAIVFCGVHFMAESAAILARAAQRVYHPNLAAGCPMADMAQVGDLERAWRELGEVLGEDPARHVMPLAYMNTTAAVKAFVGEHGGAVCTSSNADRAMRWALGERRAVLFVPDEHLGRNTACALGIPADEQVLWDYAKPRGGLGPSAIQGARAILWRGHCHVHTWFEPAHITAARARLRGCRVYVHPECRREVVLAADGAGSTAYLVKQCAAAAPGAELVIGTEINLVTRMQQEHPDRTIVPLARSLCPNMYRIGLRHLRDVLQRLDAGDAAVEDNRIEIADEVRRGARAALERMLAMP